MLQAAGVWYGPPVRGCSSMLAARRLVVLIGAAAVAKLLGAQSLDQAINGLEGLRSLASGDRALVDEVRRARAELTESKRRIAARAAALDRAESAAAATTAALEAARAERRT